MHRRAVAAVVLLILVILATGGILVSQRESPPQPAPNPPAPQPVPETLLLQVRDPKLLSLGSVLMGIRPDEQLDQMFWPADWWIDQLGVQEVSAAELGRKPVTYGMQTVQNQLQVRVDSAWVLDRLAFAGLVDAVGGVRIDVANNTTYLSVTGSPRSLAEGVNTLAGAQAADYVLDTSLKDEQVRMRRFEQVWDQVLRLFPGDRERARALIVSLGALSKSTMSSDDVADYLSEARNLRVAGEYEQGRVALDAGNRVRVKPAQGVVRAYAMDTARTPNRIGAVFGGYESGPSPVARVQAGIVRAPSIETLRLSLKASDWDTAWAGRSDATTVTAAVDPEVPAASVQALEQVLDVTARRKSLEWGQAKVSVAPNADTPVGP